MSLYLRPSTNFQQNLGVIDDLNESSLIFNLILREVTPTQQQNLSAKAVSFCEKRSKGHLAIRLEFWGNCLY